jgi:hypothetical protein
MKANCVRSGNNVLRKCFNKFELVFKARRVHRLRVSLKEFSVSGALQDKLGVHNAGPAGNPFAKITFMNPLNPKFRL